MVVVGVGDRRYLMLKIIPSYLHTYSSISLQHVFENRLTVGSYCGRGDSSCSV